MENETTKPREHPDKPERISSDKSSSHETRKKSITEKAHRDPGKSQASRKTEEERLDHNKKSKIKTNDSEDRKAVSKERERQSEHVASAEMKDRVDKTLRDKNTGGKKKIGGSDVCGNNNLAEVKKPEESSLDKTKHLVDTTALQGKGTRKKQTCLAENSQDKYDEKVDNHGTESSDSKTTLVKVIPPDKDAEKENKHGTESSDSKAMLNRATRQDKDTGKDDKHGKHGTQSSDFKDNDDNDALLKVVSECVARLHENEVQKYKEEDEDEEEDINNKPAFMNVFQQRRQKENDAFIKTRVKRTYGWLNKEDVDVQGIEYFISSC